MKKLLLGLSLVALLAGCASPQNENGMGGTGDEYSTTTSTTSSDQYNNDAFPETGATSGAINPTGVSP